MALYPGANQRPIAPGVNDPAITPCGVILHTDAGNSKSLYGYFKDKSGGIESHFHIPKEGKPEQYRDTSREADANLKANSFMRGGKRYGFISVETQGYATDEWNPHQLDEIRKILLWAHTVHGIPLHRCPAWNEDGVGYHTMWGSPGPWTPVAKDCPGKKRIKQFETVIVPWMKNTSSGGSTPTPPVEVPEVVTDADIQKIVSTLLATKVGESSVADCLAKARWTAEQFAQQGQFENQLDRIEEAVVKPDVQP
jgi:hypothetical protein